MQKNNLHLFTLHFQRCDCKNQHGVSDCCFSLFLILLPFDGRYLVLGPPGSGKSSLLKAIAGRLYNKGKEELNGSVTYNGTELYNSKGFYAQPGMHYENAVSLIDQLDRHAPRYTVEETFNFGFQCKRHKGTHIDFRFQEDNHENRELAKRADDNNLLVDTYINLLGIDNVRNSFVGNEEIRGVSGGQRRRVTIGEMMMNDSPIICGDEISNGLDAESTFEMITAMSYIGKQREKLQVISLLQPSPETVSLFDEVILLAEGRILYAGPILRVENYFASLGYAAPVHMDVGDFLQLISTSDGANLYDPPPKIAKVRSNPYTLEELAEKFRESQLGKRISIHLKEPSDRVWDSLHGNLPQSVKSIDGKEYLDDRKYEAKYQNNFLSCFWLNLKRQITLWRRDKRVLIVNAVKNFIMGISVGGVFYQTDDVISILGVLFQGMLFVMLGGMVTAPAFVNERLIYYKQNDANYYGAFSFVFAKAISKLPQTAMDCIIFGTMLYYMVGLAPQPEHYFLFLGIVFLFNVLMSEFLFVFSTFAATSSMVQTASACIVFIFMLFCGFFIPPITIPSYFKWIYWYNPLAWAYRALVVNAFRNEGYRKEEADEILKRTGFVYNDNEPFDRGWITWAFIFMCGHILLSVVLSAIILSSIRVHKKSPSSFESMDKTDININKESENDETGDSQDVSIPFKPITLSFENICYDVKASTGEEDIRLLHDVNGYFRAGRMCALMGESGAGKTTLMDVIALRKNSGTVSGDIRINGFSQEKSSFRRCSGYVEQFDIQSPQLTVRETVLFSGLLRLDSNKVKTNQEKEQFCDTVIKILELTPLATCLVGSDEEGGLSFEQKKRLSIAVELAASPSIIFLDEPTTGLDARSASLVVKLLRKIADQGRTICATIHQPSSAVFHLFDDLLLLKKGGRSVYFGELGFQSRTLIKYFEGHGATKIKPGDNPANWMLRVLPECDKDFADVYIQNSEYSKLTNQIAAVKVDPPKELEIIYLTEFAVPRSERQKLTNKRLRNIYWRSPAYNLSRLMVCVVIAFILGSVFVTERNLKALTEDQVRAYFSITFLSFIIIGILSIMSVLPVMLAIRDVFYKQLAAGMIDNESLGWALGVAEKIFIVLASFIFCLVYLATAGTFPLTFLRAFKFWGFFTFNIAIYSYFGQAFMCLVPTMHTAQILCSIFIGLNNFFSGLIVRPQYMKNIFAFTYWITPGHYVYEGLILSQYWGDQRKVTASEGSEFYIWLGCDQFDNGNTCEGTVEQYVWVFYGEMFNDDNLYQDVLVLALYLVLARVVTFFALRKFQYTNT
uniref:ABC transporter domain-containing protein n=1 Tax=Pseudo-nitzschia australis TaxID=44445 RepID=A0A7S4ACS2_9STRA